MKRFIAAFISFALATAPARSQSPPTMDFLDLDHAEAVALANQPRMLGAQLRARSIAERIKQARAGYAPTITFNATGAQVADTGSAIAAGTLATSALSGRFAYGANLTQMITDFGRTGALVSSTRFLSEAQNDIATLTRAQVRLNVRTAYYRVLGAEAVLRAAQAALENRSLNARQIAALAQSELRSTLDLNFARVLEREAQLAVVRGQSTVAQERNSLATAMGLQTPVSSHLVDALPRGEELPPSPDELQHQASTQRADLRALEAQQLAADRFAKSERRLGYPTLNALASAGQLPFHDHTLHEDYAAIGFNLSVPVFNGGLFAARRNEAELEAQARIQDVKHLRLQVNEDVRNSWYRADEAYRSLDVTEQLVAQSKEALRLAQHRYDAGLGSIVELNEAQLNETSAEIAAADAVYTYLIRRAQLDFAAGLLN